MKDIKLLLEKMKVVLPKLLNGVLNVLMIWKKNEEKKKENEKEEKIKNFYFLKEFTMFWLNCKKW